MYYKLMIIKVDKKEQKWDNEWKYGKKGERELFM